MNLPPEPHPACVNTGVRDDFEQWVHARSRALARTAYLLVGDVHLAEDLVQETLGRVAQHWDRVSRKGSPDAYAHQVMNNLAIDGWRRKSRRPHEVAADVDPATASADGSVERVVLRDALLRLTAKQRAVLLLRFYEDYSESQAAHLLGCSTNTVKSQTRHALKRLRELAPDVLAEFDDRREVARP